MQTNRRTNERGITLIEMLVVVTIIAILGAVVATNVFKHPGRARQVAAREDIQAFETALVAYNGDTGSYPSTEMGLQALRVKPEGVNNWNGPYLQKDLPMDPWGHPFLYKYPGEHGDTPDIVSLGADGQPGGEGENADILSWK